MTTCTTSGRSARFNLTTEPYLRLSVNWDRCVDAPPAFTTSGTPSEGTPVQSFGCNGTPSQRWTMRLLPTEVFALKKNLPRQAGRGGVISMRHSAAPVSSNRTLISRATGTSADSRTNLKAANVWIAV